MWLLIWLMGVVVLAIMVAASIVMADDRARKWAESPKNQSFEPVPDNVHMLFGEHRAA